MKKKLKSNLLKVTFKQTIYKIVLNFLKQLLDDDKTEEDLLIEELRNVPNLADRILLCFSWNKTYRLLLKSDVPDEVGAINGLMFFGMIFMAIYNYLIYGSIYLKHLPMEFRKYESFFGQIVANSSFAIDTFLFLRYFNIFNFFLQTNKKKYVLLYILAVV